MQKIDLQIMKNPVAIEKKGLQIRYQHTQIDLEALILARKQKSMAMDLVLPSVQSRTMVGLQYSIQRK